MPSPLVHAVAGYAGYSLIALRQTTPHSRTGRLRLLLASFISSCLPDADALVGIIIGEIGRAHNGITHSVPFGLLSSSFAGALFQGVGAISFFRGLIFGFLLHMLHLLLDLLGRNKRGLMLLAPFSFRRFRIPLRIFYGVRWDQGVFSKKHLWTLGTEMLFVAIVLTVLRRLQR